MSFRTLYAHDGRKLIINTVKGETREAFETRAANLLFPGKTFSELRKETGLNWPIMEGLDYPTKAICRAESAARATFS